MDGAVSARSPVPVIVDTDPGIDDAVALLLAFASPELDLRGITTVSGNVPQPVALDNALRVCELAGRSDIAVYAGCSSPLLVAPIRSKFSGTGGLGGVVLPAPTMPPRPGHAVDFLCTTLAAAADRNEPITVCTLGPLTNVALALRKCPGIVAGIHAVVAMGGAYREAGNRTPAAEFNFLADPHAAQIVFTSGVPIVSVPLDVTHQALATPEWVARLRAQPGAVPATVAELLTYWNRGDVARFGREGGPLHDPLVIAAVLRPDLFASYGSYVEIETCSALALGQSVSDRWNVHGRPHNTRILDRVDADAFFELLLERLARFPG